ncbi:hypothetical protein [Roseospira visakhapatnamensis]|uniref:Putative membrane protein n=1 Tax=Roseospira visakhapatnamensis TaxID=390880 RepID=A0A7W6WBQ4_9PROT|nr:hypothetical protein [Roseospira visakhapatnamensis]MBB4267782.1 putative membrane protein [Roseospira visakhapatnamensis]
MRVSRIAIPVAAALALIGCASIDDIADVMTGAADRYCGGASDAGKAAVRDRLTGGRTLIHCPDGAPEATP